MIQEKENPEILFEKGKRFYLANTGIADPSLAMFYFNKAAEAGYVPAQRLLGTCYLDGRITSTDYEKAHHWLAEAASKKDGQAAYTLAKMYVYGQGVERNLNLAFQLLDMECARNIQDVQELKQILFDEVSVNFQDLKDQLDSMEKQRRSLYSSYRRRFIQPWRLNSKCCGKEEFEIWLKLNSGAIDKETAFQQLSHLMQHYYELAEENVPDKI